MSGERNQTAAERKMRVQKLKKLIVLTLVISILVPWIGCMVLFVQVQNLRGDLQESSSRIDEMSDLLLEQRSLLERIAGESNTTGEEISPTSEAQREITQVDALSEREDEQSQVGILKREAAHKVYLTFDDGPSIYTEDILNILDQYDIKATFFVVGKEDDASKEALKQIVERGHSLGMHSYSHKYREVYRSVDDFAADFARIQNYLYDVTGVESTIYRFPGGSSNRVSNLNMEEFADYLRTRNVTFYDWNISSGDGSSKLLTVQELADNSMDSIEKYDTSIILFHDSADKRTTVEALPAIIENILAMEDTVILPITEETEPVQHINTMDTNAKE